MGSQVLPEFPLHAGRVLCVTNAALLGEGVVVGLADGPGCGSKNGSVFEGPLPELPLAVPSLML